MKQRSFNLLKPLEPPKTMWDKAYDWLLNRAKIVILITEILIAVAFFGKVIQDTDAKNKDSQISILTSELQFYSNTLEPQFRNTEIKDNLYQTIWTNSNSYAKILEEVYSYISNSASEINVRIEGRELIIFGTENLETLQKLEASLKSSDSFSSVIIRSLSLEQQAIIEQKGDYILSAVIKEPFRKPLNGN